MRQVPPQGKTKKGWFLGFQGFRDLGAFWVWGIRGLRVLAELGPFLGFWV